MEKENLIELIKLVAESPDEEAKKYLLLFLADAFDADIL